METLSFLGTDAAAPEQAASIVVGDATIYLPLADLIDLQAERERLGKELENLQSQISRSKGLLNNANFVERAKPEVVERERAKLADLESRFEATQKRLQALG